MLTEQNPEFGIHFLRNRGASHTAAASPTTAPSTTAAPATAYGFDYEIGRFAFFGRLGMLVQRRVLEGVQPLFLWLGSRSHEQNVARATLLGSA